MPANPSSAPKAENLNAKRIAMENLKPGMILARDLLDGDGNVILNKNTVLDKYNFGVIMLHSSAYVYVLENSIETHRPSFIDLSAGAPVQPVIPADIPVKQREDFLKFVTEYEKKPAVLSREFKRITEGGSVDYEGLFSITDSVMSRLHTKNDVLTFINTIRSTDEHTFIHSVNVSLLANLFGIWINASDDEVELLTVGALLHDIGMLQVPQELLAKKEPLTRKESDQIRRHTTLGYRLLDAAGMPDEIKLTALGHHEKIDGSGYPLGVKADRISRFAKIIAICDVYEAMTANRAYRERFCPFDVIRRFERQSFGSFDTEALLLFLQNIAYTYLNSQVRLSDGREGQVVFINASDLSSPIVKLNDGQIVDLTTDKGLRVKELV